MNDKQQKISVICLYASDAGQTFWNTGKIRNNNWAWVKFASNNFFPQRCNAAKVSCRPIKAKTPHSRLLEPGPYTQAKCGKERKTRPTRSDFWASRRGKICRSHRQWRLRLLATKCKWCAKKNKRHKQQAGKTSRLIRTWWKKVQMCVWFGLGRGFRSALYVYANSRAPLKTVAILCLRSVGINLDTHIQMQCIQTLIYNIQYRNDCITEHH